MFFHLALFLTATVIVLIIGPKVAKTSELLADKTGLGQALFGAIFLAACTSLPGIVTTGSAAYLGDASLAMSNGVGSIAAQTAFLALVDLTYRKENLEFVAASITNILYCFLLILLLSIVLLGVHFSDITIFHLSPFSILMVIVYGLGLRLANTVEQAPMWRPLHANSKAIHTEQEQAQSPSLRRLILQFIFFAACLAVAGYILAYAGGSIAKELNISTTIIGASMTAMATSLPELVTTYAAVRRGAFVLAVSNIVGGNAFDTLFVAVGDLLYMDGALFAGLTESDKFFVLVALCLTAIQGMGLIVRQRHGWKGIGFESTLILIIYFVSLGLLAIL